MTDSELLRRLYDVAHTLSTSAVLVEIAPTIIEDDHFKVESEDMGNLNQVLTEVRDHVARTDGVWLPAVI